MKRSPSTSSCSDSSSSIEQKQLPDLASANNTKPKSRRVRAKRNQSTKDSQVTPKRSSIYRGVTRHRWTGRYEAHLWDKSTWNSIQNKRGRQIYLGAYDNEESAARTYDLAALKYWGPSTVLNFPIEKYSKELEEMQKLTKEEYLASLRRQSSGFSRGVSKYRGVARHHQNGRWEARIGRVMGNKYLYLGTYSTQEEAAAAYDMAAIEYRGPNAVTNFDISNYTNLLKKPKASSPHQIKVETPGDQEEPPPTTELSGLGQETKEEECNEELCEMIKQEEEQEELVEEQSSETIFFHHHHQQYRDEGKPFLQPEVVPDLDFGPSIEQEGTVVTDPEEHHGHPWDLCLDIGFNSFDIPLRERHTELPDLLNDIDFDDDIHLMFDGEAYAIDLNQDAMSGSNTGCSLVTDTSLDKVVKEEKDLEASFSPSLSPLSMTSAVSGEV